MKVTYRGNMGDRLALTFYHCTRNLAMVSLLGGMFLLFTFFVAIPDANSLPPGSPALEKVIVLVIIEVFALLFPFGIGLVMAVVMSLSRKNRTLDCERTITLGEDGYVAESQYGRTESKWAIVQKLGRTRRHMFIYVSGTGAIVVPRRAFADREQWDAFFDFIRQRTGKK